MDTTDDIRPDWAVSARLPTHQSITYVRGLAWTIGVAAVAVYATCLACHEPGRLWRAVRRKVEGA
jgi:hypothetical protein